jgi:hypothetical protein
MKPSFEDIVDSMLVGPETRTPLTIMQFKIHVDGRLRPRDARGYAYSCGMYGDVSVSRRRRARDARCCIFCIVSEKWASAVTSRPRSTLVHRHLGMTRGRRIVDSREPSALLSSSWLSTGGCQEWVAQLAPPNQPSASRERRRRNFRFVA